LAAQQSTLCILDAAMAFQEAIQLEVTKVASPDPVIDFFGPT